MALSLSVLFGEWAKAAGSDKDRAHEIVSSAVAKFPAVAGFEPQVQAAIEAGFKAAGMDPGTALALAIKAIAEIRGGTAGYDPQAFGSVT